MPARIQLARLMFAAAVGVCATTLAARARDIPAAHAQGGASRPADVTGAWAFETQTYGDNCQLSGSLTLRPAGAGFSCAFTAHERCASIAVKAQETCTAERVGDALTITAKVMKVAPIVAYEPDNFTLTIKSGAQMQGELRSFHSAPVDFFRGDAPVS
jgi:hypothetical protein